MVPTFDVILGLVVVGVSIIVAIAGWITWQNCTRPLRLMTFYVTYVAVSNFVAVYLAFRGMRNLFIFHLFILIAIPFLVYIFSTLLTGFPRAVARFLTPLIIIAHIVSLLGSNRSLSEVPARGLALASVLVTFLALYSLFELLRAASKESIFFDERYWISMGSFIYFAGNAFVYSSILGEISINTWRFHNLIHIVSFLMYFGGYVWKRPAFSYS